MTNSDHISTRMAALAAMAGGLAIGISGVIRVTDTPSGGNTIQGIEHVQLAGFTVLLVMLLPVALYLGRLAGRPRAGAAAAAGAAGLAMLTLVSNVRGEDPSFFAAVAVPTNLLIFGGFVALALALKRSARLSPATAIALPFSWILTLPLSAVGGAVVAGVYYFALGWMLLNGELPRSAVRNAEPARV